MITFSGETDQDGDLSSHSKSLKSLDTLYKKYRNLKYILKYRIVLYDTPYSTKQYILDENQFVRVEVEKEKDKRQRERECHRMREKEKEKRHREKET